MVKNYRMYLVLDVFCNIAKNLIKPYVFAISFAIYLYSLIYLPFLNICVWVSLSKVCPPKYPLDKYYETLKFIEEF